MGSPVVAGDDEINQRADEVSAEERELHQHRLKIIQRERLLEARDENVVEHRHETPHEEQRGHDRERAAIVRAIVAGCACRNWAVVGYGFHLFFDLRVDWSSNPLIFNNIIPTASGLMNGGQKSTIPNHESWLLTQSEHREFMEMSCY